MKKTFRLRLLATILSLVMTMAALISPALAADLGVKTFPDVSPNAWYYQAVTAVTSDNLMSWYNDGNFHPEKEMRVCDVIGTLEKAFFGQKTPTTAAAQKTYNWESTTWVPAGFTKDYLAKATRQQTCALLMLAMGQEVVGKDPIQMALDARYINTYGNANKAFTRAEMASVLYGMMYGIYADTESMFIMDFEVVGYTGTDALEAAAAMECALEKVPENLKAAFIDRGLKLYACDEAGYARMWKIFTNYPQTKSTGMFLKSKGILVNNLTAQTVTHEFGHFLAECFGDKAQMAALYAKEGKAIMTAAGRDYGSTTVEEFMAESFRVYCIRSANIRQIPETTAYIESLLSIVDSMYVDIPG